MSDASPPPLNAFPPPPEPPRGAGMPTWAKWTLIGCGGLILLVVIFVALAALWISKNGEKFVERTGGVIQEGERAGRETDEEGCMRLAAERPGGGLSGMVNEQIWLQGCLAAAAESPGFCEAVPEPSEIRRSMAWQREQCGRGGGTRCQQRAQARQQYCAGGRDKTTIIDTYDFDTLEVDEGDTTGWDSGGTSP